MTFLELIRKLRSQVKPPPQNLEREANTENRSQNPLIWSRSYQSCRLVGMSTRPFWWVARGWHKTEKLLGAVALVCVLGLEGTHLWALLPGTTPGFHVKTWERCPPGSGRERQSLWNMTIFSMTPDYCPVGKNLSEPSSAGRRAFLLIKLHVAFPSQLSRKTQSSTFKASRK